MPSTLFIIGGFVLFALLFPGLTFAIVAAGGLAFMCYTAYIKTQFARYFPMLPISVQEAYELAVKDVRTFFVRVRNRLGR